MKTTEFKSLIKTTFQNDKVSFKNNISGTSFTSDGTIIVSALVKKGWDYILDEKLDLFFQSKGIRVNYSNDQLRLTCHTSDKA